MNTNELKSTATVQDVAQWLTVNTAYNVDCEGRVIVLTNEVAGAVFLPWHITNALTTWAQCNNVGVEIGTTDKGALRIVTVGVW